jgi:roadblock/LC7 domain-containing protein
MTHRFFNASSLVASKTHHQEREEFMKTIRNLIIAAALLALASAALHGQSGNDLFQRALVKERTEGNFAEAIKIYKSIVDRYAKTDKKLAARALLQMAECYQKLGDTEAQRIYQQIVRDYSDQKDFVATASARLGQSTASAVRAHGDRVVWAGESVFGDGRVSRDGRYITDIAYSLYLNLMLHDVVTGKDRPLTDLKDWSTGAAYTSTFSPDGKQVAYGWRTYGERSNTNELRIVNVEGTGVPQPRRVFGSDDVAIFAATDWSPDGKWLAVVTQRKDRTGQIALVGVQDGSFRALKTAGWRGPGKVFFSPDGKYIAYDLPANDDEVPTRRIRHGH